MLKFLKIMCIQKIYLQNCCNSRKISFMRFSKVKIFYFEHFYFEYFYFGISFAVQRIHLCINNYNKNKMKYF